MVLHAGQFRLITHREPGCGWVYFQAITTFLRDFNFKLNRKSFLRKSGMESIDDILLKRTSTFIFSIYYYLEPTNLAGKIMSRSYFKEAVWLDYVL